MKKIRNGLLLALVLTGSIAVFAACNDEHTHNWSAWIPDGENHTHSCECGETESQPHMFRDGVCIDCGAEEGSGSAPKDFVTVTFRCGNLSQTASVEKGQAISERSVDFSEYYVVTDWKTGDGESYDFSAAVEEPFTLTAECYSEGFTVDDGGRITEYEGKSTYVIVPEELDGYTVTGVGRNVFYYADVRKEITRIILPETMETIESRAFAMLPAATDINVPAGVRSIASDAFMSCPKLLIDFDGNDVYPKDEGGIVYTSSDKTAVFFYAGERGGDVTVSVSIPNRALYGAQIGKLTVSGSVSSVGNEAFAYSAVTELVWESSQNIPQQAFDGCASLYAVTISEGVQSIASNAFRDCVALSDLHLPQSLNSLGSGCFSNCRALTSVDLKETGVSSITGDEFRGAGIRSFSMPEGVTEIADGMFADWVGLEEFDFNDVTVIGKDAFQGCTSLTSIAIPDAVTHIGDGAFSGCSSLAQVTFGPESRLTCIGKDFHIMDGTVQEAGSGVFGGTKVADLVFPQSLQVIGVGALKGMSGLTSLSVPFIGTYSYARWKTELNDFTSNASPSVQDSNPGFVEAANNIRSKDSYDIPFFGSPAGSFSFLQLFGTVFGTTEYAGGTRCAQDTQVAYSNATTRTAYVPASLAVVTITGDTLIPAYSFNQIVTSFRLSEESVTEVIGDYAFSGCTNYSRYTFPEGLEQIGSFAFDAVTVPTVAEMPDSVFLIGADAFRNNIGLREVKLPDNADLVVHAEAFFNNQVREGVLANNHLYTVYQNPANKQAGYLTMERGQLSDSVFVNAIFEHAVLGADIQFLTVNRGLDDTEFDYRAGVFSSCKALKTVQMATDLTGKTIQGGQPAAALPGGMFSGCESLVRLNSSADGIFNIPKCTEIGNHAFSGVFGMKSFVLPEECTFLGNAAFSETGITSADIRHVTHLGGGQFYGCTSLHDITWGSAIEEFGSATTGMFEGCSALTTFHAYDTETDELTTAKEGECIVPEGLTSLPRYGFKRTAIREVRLASTLTELPMQAFYGCQNIEHITLPAGISKLGSGIFNGCTSLQSVDFADSKVTAIPSSAFEGCTMLKKVVLPEGIETIENYAFAECSSLTAVVFPASLREVGARTFQNCSALKAIYLLSSFPPEVDGGVGPGSLFYSTSLKGSALSILIEQGFRIYIPRDASEAYGNHNASYSNNSTRTFGWKNYKAAFSYLDTGYYLNAEGVSITVTLADDGSLAFAFADASEEASGALTADGDGYTFTVNGTAYTVTFEADGAVLNGGEYQDTALFKLSGTYYDFTGKTAAEQIEDVVPGNVKNAEPDFQANTTTPECQRGGVDILKEALEGDIHFYNNITFTADGKFSVNLFMATNIASFSVTRFSDGSFYIGGYIFASVSVLGTYEVSGDTVTLHLSEVVLHAGSYDASEWTSNPAGVTREYTQGPSELTMSLSALKAGTAQLALPALPIWYRNQVRYTEATTYTFSRTAEQA